MHKNDLTTLHLNLGTKPGWRVTKHGKIVASGTWELATQDELQKQREEVKERTGDIRFFRLLDLL